MAGVRVETNRVYLIGEKNKEYKIGVSGTPDLRLKCIRRQVKVPTLEVLHVVPIVNSRKIDGFWAEAFLHLVFRPWNVSGEWFQLPKGEVELFTSLKTISAPSDFPTTFHELAEGVSDWMGEAAWRSRLWHMEFHRAKRMLGVFPKEVILEEVSVHNLPNLVPAVQTEIRDWERARDLEAKWVKEHWARFEKLKADAALHGERW